MDALRTTRPLAKRGPRARPSAMPLEVRFARTELSRQRRQLIREILDNPKEAYFLSSRELARRYNVDAATIVRTIQALGYQRFADFAADLREHFVRQITPYTVAKAASQEKRSVGGHVENGLERDSENLSVLKSTLDTDRVVELATQIHRSRRILVVGVDLAASLAWFLAYGLMPLGLNAEAPVGSAGNLQHKIDGLTDKDLVIAISFGRCLRDTMHAVLRAQGARRADVRHHRRQHHADRDALRRAPARADRHAVVYRLLRRADGADQCDHAGVHAPATQARARHPAPDRGGLPIRRALVSGTAARRHVRRARSRRAPTATGRGASSQVATADAERRPSGAAVASRDHVHSRSPSLASLALADAALAQGTRLLRRPAVSRELVAFEYGGDLWTVPRSGGQARRLTSTPSAEIDPWFSPDGTRLAFTATVGGNTDVYVVPVTGGEPTRLTFHPSLDAARGWSPDGTPRAVRVDTRNRAGRPACPRSSGSGRCPSPPPARSARCRKCCRCHARSPGRYSPDGAPHRLRRDRAWVRVRLGAEPEQLVAELSRRAHASDPADHARRQRRREAAVGQQQRQRADVGRRHGLLPLRSQRHHQPVQLPAGRQGRHRAHASRQLRRHERRRRRAMPSSTSKAAICICSTSRRSRRGS